MLRRAVAKFVWARNLDLYFGIVISFVVFLLGILGVADLKYVTAATLLILTMIATSILRERWLREELVSKLSRETTWSDIENEFRGRLRQAHKVKFVGISPLGIIRKYKKELSSILQREDGEIHFVVLNPKGEAMKLVEKGRPENFDDGVLFLDEICKLFGEYVRTHRLKVKLIDYIPSHIMTMIDDGQQDGTIFATVYSFEEVDPNRPSRVITRREGLSYCFLQEEFKSLWNGGEKDHICGKKEERKGQLNEANINH